MYSRFTRFAIGAVAALSLFGAVGVAQASSLTSGQVSAIISLLQSFGADQSVINNVSAALGGQISGGLSCASFADVSYGNFDNNPGGRVSQLQTWLGIPSSTFGFGTYGNKTRSAWNARCGEHSLMQPQGGALQVSLSSATAPTTATVTGWYDTKINGEGKYSISFGDGNAQDLMCSTGSSKCDIYVTHAYNSPGTYTINLVTDPCAKVQCDKTIYYTPVVVGKSSAPTQTPTATIDQSSLMANSSTPTIMGTANTPYVRFVVIGTSSTNAWNLYTSNYVSVVNGRWSITVSQALPAGSYPVEVDGASNSSGASPSSLATGTLTVNANTNLSHSGSVSLAIGQIATIDVGDGKTHIVKLEEVNTNTVKVKIDNSTEALALDKNIVNQGQFEITYKSSSNGVAEFWVNANPISVNVPGTATIQLYQSGLLKIAGTNDSVIIKPTAVRNGTASFEISSTVYPPVDGVHTPTLETGKATAFDPYVIQLLSTTAQSATVQIFSRSDPQAVSLLGLTGVTASLDVASLSSTSAHPVISGSAVGVDKVGIDVWASGLIYGSGFFIPVVNNHWSQTVGSTLPPGSYTVKVYAGSSSPTVTAPTLATGTLVVKSQ